jgi:hypothetical protein
MMSSLRPHQLAIVGITVSVVILSSNLAATRPAKQLPVKLGTCVLTVVASIGTRLVDGPNGQPVQDSGSAITFANDGYQVSYEDVPAISRSRKGDKVYMCLIQTSTGCPPGDDRGRIYTTTNLRTMESWTLPDAEHRCGGA